MVHSPVVRLRIVFFGRRLAFIVKNDIVKTFNIKFLAIYKYVMEVMNFSGIVINGQARFEFSGIDNVIVMFQAISGVEDGNGVAPAVCFGRQYFNFYRMTGNKWGEEYAIATKFHILFPRRRAVLSVAEHPLVGLIDKTEHGFPIAGILVRA
ncbi:hypothetical protein AB870_24700 (plasmid) [Pandoraea faecigallinarum]|uniref:Uncharacterized protein n=1 Tax=Pandoraea faecigallinarum TaxID=656179 RepID=A0A0H3WZ32_9BURK|nr:hypothetical protein AB870_24700 [Pandoraea faecigallinarum]